MSIGADIKQVLSETGVAVSVTKYGSAVSTSEYADIVSHIEHTNPAIRQFFFNMMLSYDTSIAVSDIVRHGSNRYLVTAVAPEIVANETIYQTAATLLCNVYGKLQRYNQNAGWDASYTKIRAWTDVTDFLYSHMLDRMFRSSVEDVAAKSSVIESDKLTIILPNAINVQLGDRWWVSTSEYYKVEQQEHYQIPGMKVVFLSEDTRG